MKKSFYLSVLVFLLSKASLFGQVEKLSEDSIKTLLCHKWGVKAIFMAGQEINSSNETVTYKFLNDNTLLRVTEKKTEKGTWVYEKEKNLIHLIIKKKTHLYINSLKLNELQLSTTETEEEKDNLLGIKILLKPVSE
jgi:glutathione peroxidase-family protein